MVPEARQRGRSGAVGDNSVFLDAETKTMLAVGNPKTLRDISPAPKIRAFLTRGAADTTTAA